VVALLKREKSSRMLSLCHPVRSHGVIPNACEGSDSSSKRDLSFQFEMTKKEWLPFRRDFECWILGFGLKRKKVDVSGQEGKGLCHPECTPSVIPNVCEGSE
jgi:hypothetical protein